MKKLLIRTISILTGLAILASQMLGSQTPSTQSQEKKPDFSYSTLYNVDYSPPNNYVTVEEKLTISVNNPLYYYPASGEQLFKMTDLSLKTDKAERDFKQASLEVKGRFSGDLEYTLEETDTGISIHIPNTRSIEYQDPYEITVRYNTHDLINFNGNIVNLYIPGLSPDTKFEKYNESTATTTEFSYQTTLSVPSDLPEHSFIQPNTGTTEIIDNKRVYSIPQEDLVNHSAWVQIGTAQYYYFKLIQKAPKTDQLTPQSATKITKAISTNIYKIAIPKEVEETNQEVYFKKINPEPKRIERDEENNLVAVFEVPANQETEIYLEGYIKMDKSPSKTATIIPDISLEDYKTAISQDKDLQKYLKADKYWQINDPIIKEKAAQLSTGQSTIMDVIMSDYRSIVDQFNYSYEKVQGENERLGAVSALNGSQTVCMEYSDSMIAILRAQGIAARAAMGYGNDPTGAENDIGKSEPVKQTVGHQWLQVWIPEYGWLSVDPTWGESGRLYVGADLDHILWYTSAGSSEEAVDTVVYSADRLSTIELNNSDLYLQALPESEFQKQDSLKSIEEEIQAYKGSPETPTELFLKTTVLGRAVLVLLPVCTVILFFIIIIFLALKVLRRRPKARV